MLTNLVFKVLTFKVTGYISLCPCNRPYDLTSCRMYPDKIRVCPAHVIWTLGLESKNHALCVCILSRTSCYVITPSVFKVYQLTLDLLLACKHIWTNANNSLRDSWCAEKVQIWPKVVLTWQSLQVLVMRGTLWYRVLCSMFYMYFNLYCHHPALFKSKLQEFPDDVVA